MKKVQYEGKQIDSLLVVARSATKYKWICRCCECGKEADYWHTSLWRVIHGKGHTFCKCCKAPRKQRQRSAAEKHLLYLWGRIRRQKLIDPSLSFADFCAIVGEPPAGKKTWLLRKDITKPFSSDNFSWSPVCCREDTNYSKHAAILRLRLGLSDGNYYTLNELGRAFGVTRQRIEQIEVRAIRMIEQYRQQEAKHEDN